MAGVDGGERGGRVVTPAVIVQGRPRGASDGLVTYGRALARGGRPAARPCLRRGQYVRPDAYRDATSDTTSWGVATT